MSGGGVERNIERMNAALSRSAAYVLTLVLPGWVLSQACSSSDEGASPSGPGTGGAINGGSGGTFTTGGTPSGGTKAAGGSSGGTPASGGMAAGGRAAGNGGAGGSTAGGGSAGTPTAGAGAGGGGAAGGNAGSAGSAGTAGTGGGGGSGGAPESGPAFVYVSGNGPNISIFSLDVTAGTLTSKGSIAAGSEATYLAISSDRKYLYAVNETSPSRVVAFSIDATDGSLTEINGQDTMGNGAPHLAVHPSGKFVVVAHYGSGHVTVLPVRDDGGVGGVVASSRGPNDGCQKAHQIVFDTSGDHLFVPCLGSNYVMQFTFPSTGMLTLSTPATAAIEGGPRHMALHPTAPYAYVLSELNSTVTRLAYDRANGLLSAPTSIPSYETTAGSSAHIVIHPSGRFLYASNRTENSIGLFALDGTTGAVSPVAFEKSMISTPRDFAVDPSGQLLISANQGGQGDLLVFRIASADGKLTRLTSVAAGNRPSFVGITTLP
jgi:6-phosphogluconolactonase